MGMETPEIPVTAVIGGGTMGAGCAVVLASGGCDVHVMSPSAATRSTLAERTSLGLKQIEAEAPGAITAHASLRALPWDRIELVIECVSEDLELKQEIFAELEQLAQPGTILATNTSGLPLTGIGERMSDRSQLVGLHFMMPAHLVPLVEVVRHEGTDLAAFERAEKIMLRCGKRPLRVERDVPGFVANRLQHAMLREALHLIAEGVASPEGVDVAVQFGFGFRFVACGPMLQKEMSGWDTSLKAGRAIYPSLSNADEPPEFLAEMVDGGDIGMKSGKGMWTWNQAEIAARKTQIAELMSTTLEILPQAESNGHGSSGSG